MELKVMLAFSSVWGTWEIVALALFVAMYVLLLIFQRYRAYIALGVAVIFVATGILNYTKVLSSINWNVLLMISGTMGTVSLFIESKMPAKMADFVIKKAPNVKWAICGLALFAGIVSAFVDNVATVLMIAPVVLTICKKLDISPVPSLIAIAVSSNLQGAATLVGDTPSIMMAGEAGMNFLDFFVKDGKTSMFFVTQAGALAALFILLLIFRKEKQRIQSFEQTEVTDYIPSIAMVATILLLILASFFDTFSVVVGGQNITNGVICVGVFVLVLIYEMIRQKKFGVVKKVFGDIDFFTLLLLMSLFVVIAGIQEAGIINRISGLIASLGGGNVFITYTIIVWVSVLLSAFIDNIPYVATMLPVATALAASMAIDPTLLYFGLLVGATLGGNLTPVGASANIAAIGILRKNGYEVKNKDFLRIGVPFTLAAVISGYLLVWFIWKPF